MIRMYGPDQDVRLLPISGEEPGVCGISISLPELYKIIYDRLDYVRTCDSLGYSYPLSELCDIEAVAQQAMVQVRKKLGLYKDDLDAPKRDSDGMPIIPPVRKPLRDGRLPLRKEED